MPAYPFAQAPTAGQLIERFQKLGATLETTDSWTIVGPRGPVSIRYLRRGFGKTVLASEPLPVDDEERIGWDMLWRICRQLRVDVQDLGIPGLHLGPTAQ